METSESMDPVFTSQSIYRPTGACTHKSAGIIVWHPNQNYILLLERALLPEGIAAPAGHVEEGETYEAAARRELQEETGLEAGDLRQVFEGTLLFPCRRAGGNEHAWQVFETTATGLLVPSFRETRALGWYSIGSIGIIATRSHIPTSFLETRFEPVWLHIFEQLSFSRAHLDTKRGIA